MTDGCTAKGTKTENMAAPLGAYRPSLLSLSLRDLLSFVCELCWKYEYESSRGLYLPSQLGSSLPATGTGCPWRGSG